MSESAFENIETSITGGVTDSLEVVGNLIGSVAPIFSGLFAIYLLLWAFQYWANGGLVEMGVDFFKRLIGWSLVIGFAFNGSEYIQLAKLIYYFSYLYKNIHSQIILLLLFEHFLF